MNVAQALLTYVGPNWPVYLIIFALSALISYGVVEFMLKPLLDFLYRDKPSPPAWRTSALRGAACVIGAVLGMWAGDYAYGTGVGFIGGLFSIPIYHLFANRISNADFQDLQAAVKKLKDPGADKDNT